MSSSASSSDSEPPSISKRPHAKEVNEDHDSSTSASDAASSSSDNDTDTEEIPVLSHAEKRRQKKKEQKQPDPADTDEHNVKKTKVRNTAEVPPSKAPKRQHSVWVGNLAFKTTAQSLRQFFDGVGEITRIHMPMKMSSGGPSGGAVKENRGFAYVDFATADAKTVATTLSENPLDGRRLLIKDGDDYTGRPSTSKDDLSEGASQKLTGTTKTAQKILKSQKQPPGPTLFLGNLGFEATEETIRDMFDRTVRKSKNEDAAETEVRLSSSIRKIRMGTFEDSGKCKGWTFVDFKTTEGATAALTSRKAFYLDGRQLVVEFASPDAVRRGGFRGDKKEGGADSPYTKDKSKRKAPEEQHADNVVDAVDATGGEEAEEKPWKRRRTEGDKTERRHTTTKDGRPKVRPKPGAALAQARREVVAIVPSQGKKIVF
ncbi:hypothetical protein QCA50_000644 [Cerrena zonata]|uniref:RRM domain-containing protein n=1 Tax=Cerrena zonata TaxID=2478898 RepID=A0AAW0GX63_9APHY